MNTVWTKGYLTTQQWCCFFSPDTNSNIWTQSICRFTVLSVSLSFFASQKLLLKIKLQRSSKEEKFNGDPSSSFWDTSRKTANESCVIVGLDIYRSANLLQVYIYIGMYVICHILFWYIMQKEKKLLVVFWFQTKEENVINRPAKSEWLKRLWN